MGMGNGNGIGMGGISTRCYMAIDMGCTTCDSGCTTMVMCTGMGTGIREVLLVVLRQIAATLG